MDVVTLLAGAFVGLLIGLLCAWIWVRKSSADTSTLKAQLAVAENEAKNRGDRLVEAESNANEWRAEYENLNVKHSSVVAESESNAKHLREQIAQLERIEENLKDQFQVLSAKVLEGSTGQLLKQAEEVLKQHKERADGDLTQRQKAIESLVEPLKEKLKDLEQLNQHLDQRRVEDHTSMKDQLERLNKGTGQLITALQGSGSSGRFGEMTLKNLVEMAGLVEHADFRVQETMETESGKVRPDMVVRLPGGSEIIIDSKAPVHDFELLEDEGADMDLHGKALASKLLEYAKNLNKRGYSGKENAPDFVVMFLASESLYRLANKGNPDLVGKAMDQNVLIASPTNLLGLLKVVQFGWRQEKLAEEAQSIQKIGKDLYDAVCALGEHYAKLGRSLQGAVNQYNSFGGSLERNVLPKARRMKDSGIQASTEMPELAVVETQTRELNAVEITDPQVKAKGLEQGLFTILESE